MRPKEKELKFVAKHVPVPSLSKNVMSWITSILFLRKMLEMASKLQFQVTLTNN